MSEEKIPILKHSHEWNQREKNKEKRTQIDNEHLSNPNISTSPSSYVDSLTKKSLNPKNERLWLDSAWKLDKNFAGIKGTWLGAKGRVEYDKQPKTMADGKPIVPPHPNPKLEEWTRRVEAWEWRTKWDKPKKRTIKLCPRCYERLHEPKKYKLGNDRKSHDYYHCSECRNFIKPKEVLHKEVYERIWEVE